VQIYELSMDSNPWRENFKRLSKKKKKTALIDQINWIFRKTKKIGG
jgi:hypothetical protein